MVPRLGAARGTGQGQRVIGLMTCRLFVYSMSLSLTVTLRLLYCSELFLEENAFLSRCLVSFSRPLPV